ncbi:MAG TPA: NAD(P)/FAD-dependent oxidoreductase [Nocardioidaceae bacterium]|nr:NAD(P)/FAD-dependent oxidoreductase [Nocardioidaceae bacterium]
MTEPDYHVAVIGAGVVGAAVARELSRHDVRCVLLESGDDVGTGTSKANTAVRHTGFDAKPGSLESSLLARGYPLMTDFAAQTGVPIETTGALLVAWDEDQLAALDGIAANARANGYTAIRPVRVSELYQSEPHLGPGAHGALLIPDEGIMCPFTTPLALATDAVVNGVELRLDSAVTDIHLGEPHTLMTASGTVTADWVVNAAGLYSDEIDRKFGHESFTVTPRRGQLIVFDKLARSLLTHVLLPVPTSRTKGVLVAPTVFGNVLLGPTAEDLGDKTATETTGDGLASLLDKGRPILPELLSEEVTATYSGLRAATEHSDYQITCHPDQNYVCAGGIRSTGLSASLGVAAHVLDLLTDAGLKLREKQTVTPVRMPMLGEAFMRPYQDEEAIASNPAYGEIVCHCERVTRAELIAAAASAVPARTMDGVRRRTRAMLGRCQGFYCSANVTSIFASASGQSPASPLRTEEGGNARRER